MDLKNSTVLTTGGTSGLGLECVKQLTGVGAKISITAGVRTYTQALRLQLKDTRVKVFEMIPPGVKTNLQNDWVLPPNHAMMMDVDKMVNVAIKGLRKDKPELKPPLTSLIKTVEQDDTWSTHKVRAQGL